MISIVIFIILIFAILTYILYNYHINHLQHVNNKFDTNYINHPQYINNTFNNTINNTTNNINFILNRNIPEKLELQKYIELFYFYSSLIQSYPNKNNTIIFDQLKIYKKNILNILQSYIHVLNNNLEKTILSEQIKNTNHTLSNKLNDLSIIIEKYIYINNFNSQTKIPDHINPFNYHKDIFSNYSYDIN
jgi:hypothetical protein